jgi:predicted Zn-dependent protease
MGQMEEWENGKVELAELIGLDAPTMRNLRGRAQLFLDGGHHERALIMLEMLEALDRKDPLPKLLAIGVLLELGRSDEAEQKLDELDPKEPATQVARAELLVASGQLAPAAKLLQQVVDRHPSTEHARRALAVAKRAHDRQ